MGRNSMTVEELEREIQLLRQDKDGAIALARKEQSIKSRGNGDPEVIRQRKRLYQLRWQKKRGRKLMDAGVTRDNIESRLADGN